MLSWWPWGLYLHARFTSFCWRFLCILVVTLSFLLILIDRLHILWSWLPLFIARLSLLLVVNQYVLISIGRLGKGIHKWIWVAHEWTGFLIGSFSLLFNFLSVLLFLKICLLSQCLRFRFVSNEDIVHHEIIIKAIHVQFSIKG